MVIFSPYFIQVSLWTRSGLWPVFVLSWGLRTFFIFLKSWEVKKKIWHILITKNIHFFLQKNIFLTFDLDYFRQIRLWENPSQRQWGIWHNGTNTGPGLWSLGFQSQTSPPLSLSLFRKGSEMIMLSKFLFHIVFLF